MYINKQYVKYNIFITQYLVINNKYINISLHRERIFQLHVYTSNSCVVSSGGGANDPGIFHEGSGNTCGIFD